MIDASVHSSTSFVGRETDLAELQRILADPGCRLVTVTGPGGVGKTRLTLAAIEEIPIEKIFVPLQPVTAADAVLPAVADALGFILVGENAPVDQLAAFLGRKNILLILDNLEHVIDCAGDLSKLLTAAPGIKLLVTSREVLNLQEEWLLPLSGLSFPLNDSDDDLETYGAVALFCDRVRRQRPDFILAEEREAVLDICRLTGGLPLALELAASWIRTMASETIAAEIKKNLHFLNTRLRNVPERHRSMRAVYNQSWQMLAPEEQNMYARLSAFRGGFRREAAEQVTGASLQLLTKLVDKSLLMWEASGRFQIHELLRQFARESLSHFPDQLIDTFHNHCAYYTTFLTQRQRQLFGGEQLESAAVIEQEVDNIRAAWTWAIHHGRWENLRQMIIPLSYYFQLRGRYLDGIQTLEIALAALPEDEPVGQESRALLLVALAWYELRFGHISRSQALAEECLTVYQESGFPLPLPNGHTHDPELVLGVIATIHGDYAGAARTINRALERSQSPQAFYGNRQTAYYQLASIASAVGDFTKAHEYAQAAFAAAEEVQDRWFMAYCHLELGKIARQQGGAAVARRHFQASFEMRERFGDAEGMAVALTHLGEIALLEQDPKTAQELFQRGIFHYEQVLDPGGLATAYVGAARAALAVRDGRTARDFLAEALQMAGEMEFVTLVLTVLVEVGHLLKMFDRSEAADVIFAAASSHPAISHEAQIRIPSVTAIPEDLESVVALAKNTLSDLSFDSDSRSSSDASQQANQALVEPLTPRELEILRLIAAGMSNREIADHFVVVVGTIKAHTNNLYGKLGVRSRTQAAARARELGLI